MITAEATGERDESARDGDEQPSPSRPQVPPSSPLLSASWLLRTAAFVAVAAGVMGVIVAPGAHGNTSDLVVVRVDWAAACLGYFLVALLVALVAWGGLELLRMPSVGWPSRAALIAGGSTVAILWIVLWLLLPLLPPPFREARAPWSPVTIAAAAAVAAIAAAYTSARAPHTRAAAGILFAFAFATIARIAAWELATAAGDTASMPLFRVSRMLATAGVLFEASGQLVAVMWIWTRSRVAGQLGVAAALAATVAIMLGVRSGMHSGAAPWQSVLHTALADAGGVPAPYWFESLAVFLVPASLLLALVAAAQPGQVAAVVAAMSLALVSRGAFDAPLRALCAVVASQWAVLACADERAMWRVLLGDRKRKLEEDG
jgi:hypothetical protein